MFILAIVLLVLGAVAFCAAGFRRPVQPQWLGAACLLLALGALVAASHVTLR